MTELKFTFQDGSEGIAHYGVKGMKWGSWNAETQARYAGKTLQGGGGISEEDDGEKSKEEKEAEARKKQEELQAHLSRVTEGYEKRVAEKVDKGDIPGAVSEAVRGSRGNAKEGQAVLAEAVASKATEEAKKKVDRVLSEASAKVSASQDLMRKGDQLSDSERAELRAKAKEGQKEKKRKKQEEAKTSGNPLWMFM